MPTVSVVTNVQLSALEAFSTLEQTLGTPLRDATTANPWLPLGQQVTLTISVPKFGEDLPLTLDLDGSDDTTVTEAAQTLSEKLSSTMGWICSIHTWERRP